MHFQMEMADRDEENSSEEDVEEQFDKLDLWINFMLDSMIWSPSWEVNLQKNPQVLDIVNDYMKRRQYLLQKLHANSLLKYGFWGVLSFGFQILRDLASTYVLRGLVVRP